MRTRLSSALALSLAGAAGCANRGDPSTVASVTSEHLEIRRAATLTATKGAPDRFTGDVAVTQLFGTTDRTRASGGSVSFEPGARSVWHSHPAGQTLIVTAGTGWIEEWGGKKQVIKPGDVVWTPPGVKHWHGATATEGMTHIAIQEQVGGSAVTWMEPVTDAQYGSSSPQVHSASPALERYTQSVLLDEIWKRPGLSARDRSIVTLAVLIARNQTVELRHHLDLALDHGVKAGEISEMIAHLAFYAGWANATSAVAIAKQTFDQRGIGADQLPPASVPLLPLDRAAEAQRAARVEASFGAIAPGVVHYTTDVLFHDLWLRPGLAPRDRSVVTVAALVANGQVAQIAYHLDRALDNGLTKTEASEMMTQLAFYAGWPTVFSALPAVKDVLEKR